MEEVGPLGWIPIECQGSSRRRGTGGGGGAREEVGKRYVLPSGVLLLGTTTEDYY